MKRYLIFLLAIFISYFPHRINAVDNYLGIKAEFSGGFAAMSGYYGHLIGLSHYLKTKKYFILENDLLMGISFIYPYYPELNYYYSISPKLSFKLKDRLSLIFSPFSTNVQGMLPRFNCLLISFYSMIGLDFHLGDSGRYIISLNILSIGYAINPFFIIYPFGVTANTGVTIRFRLPRDREDANKLARESRERFEAWKQKADNEKEKKTKEDILPEAQLDLTSDNSLSANNIILKKLDLRARINKTVASAFIFPGSFTLGAGLTLIGIGIGCINYSLYMLDRYWDTDLSIEKNYENSNLRTAGYYTTLSFYFFISGGILTCIGLISDIIAIPFFVKANFIKKLIEKQEGKMSLIPFFNINDGIKCGIVIKV